MVMITKVAAYTMLALMTAALTALMIIKMKGETPMAQAVENRAKPPIDKRAPASVKTATFGLG